MTPPSLTPAGGNALGADDVFKMLRYGSLAVLGGYTVALCYRVGLFRKVLPRHVNEKVEQTVNSLKAKTEPIGNVKRFAMARRHLVETYGFAASGMVTAAAGVVLFCVYPKLPIAIPLAATVVSAISLVLPKHTMIPAGRMLSFYTATLGAGYCFGPVGWAAQDTLVVFVMLTGCTMTGLCLPLFLTRGMVSYVASSQLLSVALSLALVTAPKTSKPMSPFKYLKAQRGVQVILNGDVNVLLTMQLITNVGINVLHTLPVIYRFISSTDPDEELEAKADPLKEAFCICAGWGYVNYRIARYFSRKVIRRVCADNTRSACQGSEGAWTMAASGVPAGATSHTRVNIASSVVAGLVSVLWYVRAVSLLQKGDAEATLNRVRSVCARMSPVALLLGIHSDYMATPHS